MDQGETQFAEQLIRMLRQYVRANPRAADTVEGISRWWVPRSVSPVPATVLEGALDVLVQAGDLVRSTTPGGAVVYAARRTAGADGDLSDGQNI